MKKTIATFAKEWIIFRRDVAGMLVLMLMPALLIIIMALVQDAPFRDYSEARFELLVADADGGSLPKEIISGLRASHHFIVIDSIDGRPLNEQSLRKTLQAGKYHVGIMIPKGATAEVINSANHLVNTISGSSGMTALPERARNDSLVINILFEPAAKPAFRTAIMFALERNINGSTTELMVHRLAKMNENAPVDTTKLSAPTLPVREAPLSKQTIVGGRLNSVQHNVPAWAIFGMFFIVIPLSGQVIRERDEGSALRIRLIPGAKAGAGLGKILFYTLICSLQFALMCALGLWIIPYFGLPALHLGAHPAVLLLIVPAIAFAATAFGFAVGTTFRTANQALPFGAISMVILSAIGGIWVPIELLPPLLQKAAIISPLHWGLEGIQGIILRDGGLQDVWKDIVALIIFGTILWTISLKAEQRNLQSVQV